jgi:hypothetical protein
MGRGRAAREGMQGVEMARRQCLVGACTRRVKPPRPCLLLEIWWRECTKEGSGSRGESSKGRAVRRLRHGQGITLVEGGIAV